MLTNARIWAWRGAVGTLARVPLGGAGPRAILEGVSSADWSPDGNALAVVNVSGERERLEYPVGTVLYDSSGALSWVRVSPRGDQVALFEYPSNFDDRGYVITVSRSGKRTVLAGEFGSLDGLARSPDGNEVLFTAGSSGGYGSHEVHAVDLAGRARVVLGSAGGLTLHDVSQSGRWLVSRDDRVLAITQAPPQVVVYAVGSGEKRVLDRGGLVGYGFASWFPDGKRILVCGHEEVKVSRCYVQEVAGGAPRALTPDGERGIVSPDGSRVVVWHGAVKPVIYRTDGGVAESIPSASTMDWPVRWSADGTSLLLLRGRSGQISGSIERISLASGKREVVMAIDPPDRAGLLMLASASATADASSYVYGFFRMQSTLFLVDRAR